MDSTWMGDHPEIEIYLPKMEPPSKLNPDSTWMNESGHSSNFFGPLQFETD